MEKGRAKENLIRNGIRYLLYFAAVAVTPVIAGWLAPLFSFVGYSQMILFFKEIFTGIFWVIELCAAYSLEKKFRQKEEEKRLAEELAKTPAPREEEHQQVTLFATVDERSASLPLEEEALPVGEAPLPVEKENEGGRCALKEKKAEKEPRPLLPMKNVLRLGGLVILCILILSAQIGFNVKIFHDITGTGYDMVNTLGTLGKNIVKCVWIVWFLKITQAIGGDLMALREQEQQKKWIYWMSQIGLLFLFALFDVWVSGMSIGFALTYLILFYPSFIAVNVWTEGSGVKAYFLILLIYLL